MIYKLLEEGEIVLPKMSPEKIYKSHTIFQQWDLWKFKINLKSPVKVVDREKEETEFKVMHF